MEPSISAIIVSYNRADDLRLAIEALLACRYPRLQIVVVDNSSSDGCADAAASFAGVRVIRNDHNAGFAVGNNIGLRACSGDYVALVNNDAVVAPDWLARLGRFLEDHAEAAAAGGKMYLWDDDNPLGRRDNHYYGYSLVDADVGHSHATMDVPDETREVATLSGAAVMVRRRAIDDVGEPFLEPAFFSYYEETDFFARALRRGWKLFYTGEPAAWHRVRASGDPYRYFYHMERNRLLYVARNFHTGRVRLAALDAAARAVATLTSPGDLRRLADPHVAGGAEVRARVAAWWWLVRHARDVNEQRAREMRRCGQCADDAVRAIQSRASYWHHDRPEVRALVPRCARRIIDVGCGAGSLGRALKRERPDVEVRGIELEREAAALAARALDDVRCARAEEGLPPGWERPDCVIFADVLEHLADPWRVLATWYDALVPGGTVVLSVPNVAHYSVAFDLAAGSWRYAEAGVLDRTHLRFFTRNTAVRLCESAGFRVVRLERQQGLPDTSVHRWVGGRVARWARTERARLGLQGTRRRLADGCTVQYLALASKDEEPTGPVAAFRGDRVAPTHDVAPLVSVVIVNHNYGAYVGSAIESARRQSHPNVEIVVVDDGSTDDSVQVITRHGARLVRQERMGVVAARNRGASATRGEFLCFLDADDILESNYVATCLDALMRAPDDVVYAYTSMRLFGHVTEIFEPPSFDDALLCADNFVHASALLRRAAFELVGGFHPAWNAGREDWELWLRLLARGYRGVFVPDTVLHYRRHVSSRDTLTAGELEDVAWKLRLAFPRLYWRALARHPVDAVRRYRRARGPAVGRAGRGG